MNWKRRIGGGLMGFVGFILSPLSWWNDLVVNVPLAVGAAWLVALVYPPAFKPAVVVAYWMTNLIGLILMHKGARRAMVSEDKLPSRSREFLLDLAVSLLYTLVILLLFKLGVLRPIENCFTEKPA